MIGWDEKKADKQDKEGRTHITVPGEVFSAWEAIVYKLFGRCRNSI
jgi:hypothetical protein